MTQVVGKTWGEDTIMVNQHWLDVAKELVRKYGIGYPTQPIEILTKRMGRLPEDEDVHTIFTIAEREVGEELAASNNERISEQTVKIAELLDIQPVDVMVTSGYGIVLTPDQVDKLFLALALQGWKSAGAALREAATKARNGGEDWQRVAAMATGASFVQNLVHYSERTGCTCATSEHCKQHCGGAH